MKPKGAPKPSAVEGPVIDAVNGVAWLPFEMAPPGRCTTGRHHEDMNPYHLRPATVEDGTGIWRCFGCFLSDRLPPPDAWALFLYRELEVQGDIPTSGVYCLARKGLRTVWVHAYPEWKPR